MCSCSILALYQYIVSNVPIDLQEHVNNKDPVEAINNYFVVYSIIQPNISLKMKLNPSGFVNAEFLLGITFHTHDRTL